LASERPAELAVVVAAAAGVDADGSRVGPPAAAAAPAAEARKRDALVVRMPEVGDELLLPLL